jgi:hypothetical protein
VSEPVGVACESVMREMLPVPIFQEATYPSTGC